MEVSASEQASKRPADSDNVEMLFRALAHHGKSWTFINAVYRSENMRRESQ